MLSMSQSAISNFGLLPGRPTGASRDVAFTPSKARTIPS
jgi:hypothetical protein